MLRLPDRQPDPTRAQNAQELAVREHGDVALQCSQPRKQSIRSFGNLSGRFTVWLPRL